MEAADLNGDGKCLTIYPTAGEAFVSYKHKIRTDTPDRTWDSDRRAERVSRATTQIRRYVKANKLLNFVTCTFATEPIYEEAKYAFQQWIRRMNKYLFDGSFPYIGVIEGFNPLQRFHIHAFVPDATIEELKNTWRHGFIRKVQFPFEQSGIKARYVAKDMNHPFLFDKRAYFSGNGFKPEAIVIPMSESNPYEILKGQFGIGFVAQNENSRISAGRESFSFKPVPI